MSMAAPQPWALRLPVSLTARQLNPPADGQANFLIGAGSWSSSADTARSLSATPLTVVTRTKAPPDLGSQAILTSLRSTSPFVQSPYILLKNAILRKRPGSSCGPGGAAGRPLT